MIDALNENLLTLSAASRKIPGRSGQGVNPSTLWRWCMRGVRGVRLETLMIGGVRKTSTEAIQRFFERVTAAADGHTERAETPARRRRAVQARAERELIAAGL